MERPVSIYGQLDLMSTVSRIYPPVIELASLLKLFSYFMKIARKSPSYLMGRFFFYMKKKTELKLSFVELTGT